MGRPAIVTREPMALPEHELLARVFRTLGDPTRLRILETLQQMAEASQSELIERTGVTQSRASEHLACLTWCGFVEARRQGRTVRYRLMDEHAAAMLDLVRDFLAGNGRAVGCCTALPESVAAAGYRADTEPVAAAVQR
jgi:DNA-binding transcriptional ArsR family regulator